MGYLVIVPALYLPNYPWGLSWPLMGSKYNGVAVYIWIIGISLTVLVHLVLSFFIEWSEYQRDKSSSQKQET